ncbi:ABC transporter substrate-binding protein [Nocardioides islandensis]|jgi:multiple sugar transport system substrate-binding protein|uniref:ABC transporter substrate-binding protein n=1 Tax=Nocardioides islandensis TaxID=433663 RepID=A0A930VCW2_9ACTN|nr:ABC transporter substrate-binding protein [Nocardioides islandensis]MBF4762261.1 ABC transporter substrate-binding protein [Nocardioides islandensis]
MTRTPRRRLLAAIAVLSLPLAVGACTGDSGGGKTDNPDADVTITFWHGWSADSEVAAIQATIDAFEKDNPNIHVKVVGGITDDKINQALRAGGPQAPDVVSSFTTDNVGQFCSSGAFADLSSFMADSGVDPAATFPSAQLSYTQYDGNQCALPLLSDAYGLYYNKDAFAAAGIDGPPKTMSEFDADAVKLTKTSGDSYSQLGFMPTYHGYESSISHLAAQWSPTYFTADGKSNVAADPMFAQAMEWQKGLVDKLGGYAKLEKYRNTFGDEWGAKNPFMTGQVAMAIDGEWRAGMIQADAPDLDFGVAPFPVPDDQADTYGKGYITGTIVGIASTSQKQNAAWRFVKYLTTDTDAVVNFANAIHNVPSTIDALASPDVSQDEAMQTFIAIASNPASNTTPASPNGGAYQLTLQDVGYAYESGKDSDLKAALTKAAEQIDTDIAQAQ